MDDLGSNLAGDTTPMETPVNPTSELRKRRSTRIVQAVPLQVTGVDALGRPFVERTSSLILNCHGCRYQSKHYVLKNMWVKLEIPHADSDQPARTVRGRVAWIQRPRTVRQLFQVALELETPGNVWGIGFPPEDWFGCVEEEKEKAHAAGAGTSSAYSMPASTTSPAALLGNPAPQPANGTQTQPSSSEPDFNLSTGEAESSPSGSPDNVRVFPSPASTTDASLQLARHVTRLLTEARQQIQATAREAAAQAVAAERRITAEEWDRQVADAHAKLMQELSTAIEKVQEEANSRSRAAHEIAAALLQEELPKRLAPQFEELTRDLTTKLSEEGQAQRAEHQQQLAAMSETIGALVRQAEEASARLRAAETESEAQIASHSETAQKLIEEAARQREETASTHRQTIEATARDVQEQITSSMSSAQERWHSHLNGELEAAQTRWQAALDNSFAAAHERAAGVLEERANGLRVELQQEADRRADTVRQVAASTRNESEQHAGGLRDALNEQAAQMEARLARANEASDRLENFSARLETVQQHALSGFQSQVDDLLNLHRNELHRRSESIFEEITGRIRGTFEQASDEALKQFSQQVETLVQPHIERTDEAVQRMAGGRSLLDAAVTMHQERIRATTDEAFAEAQSQLQAKLGEIEESVRQSADTATSRSLSDLDSRVEEVKHKAVEDLIRSAEWYEKKAMTQIQGLADKVGEQATAGLRERATEVANEFSCEIDQSSRNFISYAQTQMAEVVGDSFDRVRGLFTEAAETTTAAFIDEIQRHGRQDLEAFDSELQKAAIEARLHLDAAHADLTQKVSAEQEDFLRRFQSQMSGAVEAEVANANERVQAGFEPLLKSWKSMTEAHQTEMYEIYTKLGEQAAQQYRERLDNVSNQWMLATVTSLDHQSRDAVSKIAASAEERLRETCTNVFADIGDSLRERLKEISSNLNVRSKNTNGGTSSEQ